LQNATYRIQSNSQHNLKFSVKNRVVSGFQCFGHQLTINAEMLSAVTFVHSEIKYRKIDVF